MAETLRRQLREKLYTLQSMTIMLLATLLNPRFKKIGFFRPNKAADAEKRLTCKCTAVIRNRESSSSSSSLSSEASKSVTQGNGYILIVLLYLVTYSLLSVLGSKLWYRLDTTVLQTRTKNVTADTTVEVKRT